VGPFGSTVVGHSIGRAGGLRQLAARVVCRGQSPLPPEELAALLLPMVRRAVRTRRGPAALLGWLRQRAGPPRAGHPTELAARRLTADLVRALVDPPGRPGDTLDDAQ
jgi:hypothetical protein